MKEIAIFSSEVQHLVTAQNEPRTSWNEHDSQNGNLEQLFLIEFQEYEQAKQECMIGGDPKRYASEVGDLGYLYIKAVSMEQETDRMSDIIQAVLIECEMLGIDIEKAIVMKVFRNDIKYPLAWTLNGWDYEQSKELSKLQYALLGGDEAFYQMYQELGEQIF